MRTTDNMKKNRHFRTLLLSAALVLPLAACQTTSATGNNTGLNASIAQSGTATAGNAQSLDILEHAYMKDSKNPANALKYAAALRDAGRLNRAAMVLAPLAEDEKNDNADICAEYAAVQAAMGNYQDAEMHARHAVLLAPEKGKGYHILGIALDAQGHSKEAEVAFRKALDNWEGDPVPVLNNLGLNLASQGFIDDALDTLRKAADLAPGRTEIERNLRIVSALQMAPPKHGMRLVVPTPRRKPEHQDNTPT